MAVPDETRTLQFSNTYPLCLAIDGLTAADGHARPDTRNLGMVGSKSPQHRQIWGVYWEGGGYNCPG